jgi:putative tricarboxylic transport membrane protein
MDILAGLAHGFSVALMPSNLLWCLVGCFLGTVVGILPGLGPAATIAMLLPMTYNMSPASGIIMLTGIYYGAKYGGSTTSILLNMPGESSSVVTCIDGYQMARKGRAGAALGIAAIASFIAGSFGIIALSVMAPPIAAFALTFSSPEYFALMALGLALVVLLAGDSLVKGLIALLVGLWLTSIGTDLFTSQSRFTFGQTTLLSGLDFMVVAIGVFAITEVMASISEQEETQVLPVPKSLRNLLPNWEELKACRFAFANGSIVGFIIGVLPGAGASIASFISYGIERAFSRHPEKFGTGLPYGRRIDSAADAWHSRRRHDGHSSIGPCALGREARPAHDDGISRCLLGPCGEPLYRQCDALDPQSADGAALCADFANPRLYSASDDFGRIGDWRLFSGRARL